VLLLNGDGSHPELGSGSHQKIPFFKEIKKKTETKDCFGFPAINQH